MPKVGSVKGGNVANVGITYSGSDNLYLVRISANIPFGLGGATW